MINRFLVPALCVLAIDQFYWSILVTYLTYFVTNFQKKYVSWLQDWFFAISIPECLRATITFDEGTTTVPTGFSYWHRIDLVYECIVSSSKWDRWILSDWYTNYIRRKEIKLPHYWKSHAFLAKIFSTTNIASYIFLFTYLFFLIVYITGCRTN